jgi:hypothetical protein
MQEQPHKYVLVPYSSKYATEAFSLIMRWTHKQNGGDVSGAFNSTTKLLKWCKLVLKDGEVYAVLYPDFHSFDFPHYVKVHSVLSEKACACKNAQVAKFDEYLEFLFSSGFKKVALEFPAISRLTKKLANDLKFVPEGIKRQEWPLKKGYCDVFYYGLLKEEYYGR